VVCYPYWQLHKIYLNVFMKIKDKMVKHIKNFVTLMKTDCSDYFLKCLHTDFECNINKLKEWLRASSKRSECSDLWILCSSSELLKVATITHHRQMHSERFCSSQALFTICVEYTCFNLLTYTDWIAFVILHVRVTHCVKCPQTTLIVIDYIEDSCMTQLLQYESIYHVFT
jgi:hypothetical protein